MSPQQVLGVQVFSRATWGSGLSRLANFTQFGPSMLLLFRMLTGEEWHAFMYDCMATREQGCEEHIGGCLPYWWAPVYFASFCLVGMYMLSNLFVAVVIDNFGAANASVLDEAYRNTLTQQWRLYATGKRLPLERLEGFLTGIGPPLGLYPDSLLVKPFIKELDLHAYTRRNGDLYIHQDEIYPKLFSHAFGTPLPEKTLKKLRKRQDSVLKSVRGKDKMTPLSEINSIVKVQAICRGFLLRAKMQKWRASNPTIAGNRWQTFTSDEGETYYYDTVAGVTQWEKPFPSLSAEELRKYGKGPRRSRGLSVAPHARRLRGYNETVWVQLTDEDTGTPYYHDIATGKTTWDQPLIFCHEI